MGLARDALAAVPEADFAADELEAICRGAAEGHGWKAGDFFRPLRVAITGRLVSPPLFGSMELLGGIERWPASMPRWSASASRPRDEHDPAADAPLRQAVVRDGGIGQRHPLDMPLEAAALGQAHHLAQV